MEDINIFISYSNKDRKFLDDLKVYINPVNCKNIKVWDDGDISVSENWNSVIKDNLLKADIVLLLISPHFLISEYIKEVEQQIIFRKEAEGNCKVIPIYIRECKLSPFPEIQKLQGFPRGQRPLSGMKTPTKDREYPKLIDQINEMVQKLIEEKNQVATEININDSIENGDVQSGNAKMLLKLSNTRDIFLSIPESEEGRKKRERFLYQVEGKIKYEKWPYKIVPDMNQAEEIIRKPKEDQKRLLVSFLEKSIYSIHLFTKENELTKGFDRDQYDWIEMNFENANKPFKSILWLLNSSANQNLTEDLKKNPTITGDNYEGIFELIKGLDIQKSKLIKQLTPTFSPRKTIFLFYDFNKDHDNDLRIKLKSKIEEKQNFYVTFSVPDSQLEKEKSDLEKCDAAVIFYGATDSHWFVMKQAILLEAKNIKTRAVCIDEPEIDRKISRDIRNKNFETTIKGEKELDPGVKHFIEDLKMYSSYGQ